MPKPTLRKIMAGRNIALDDSRDLVCLCDGRKETDDTTNSFTSCMCGGPDPIAVRKLYVSWEGDNSDEDVTDEDVAKWQRNNYREPHSYSGHSGA